MQKESAPGIRASRSHPRRILFSLLAALLAAVVSLGVAELLFLLLQGDKYKDLTLNYFPPGSVIYDKAIGWKYRPSYRGLWHHFESDCEVNINSLGLRDREYGKKTRPRLLFLGDSFTFGVGVDIAQTFVRLAEKRIGDGAAVECINAGRIGAGTDEYLCYAERYSSLLNPDLIVLNIFPENDFDETWAFHSKERPPYHEVNGEVYVGDEPLARERKHRAGILFRNSALYRFVRLRLYPLPIGVRANLFAGTWLDVHLKIEPEWLKGARAKVFENLDRIAHLCSERNIGLVLVLIPSPLDIHPRLWKQAIAKSRRPLSAYDPDKPFHLCYEYGKERELPVLDLRAPMTASGKTCYFKHNGHFNPTGHQIAAEAIAKFLTEKQLVPDAAR